MVVIAEVPMLSTGVMHERVAAPSMCAGRFAKPRALGENADLGAMGKNHGVGAFPVSWLHDGYFTAPAAIADPLIAEAIAPERRRQQDPEGIADFVLREAKRLLRQEDCEQLRQALALSMNA